MKAWLRRHRRNVKIGLLLAGTFFMLGFFKKYHVPQLKQWLLIEIESLTRQHSPVRVWAERMKLRFFPLGGTFYNVRLTPQKELEGILQPTVIEEARISLSPWALFKGQIKLAEIRARGAEFHIKLPPTEPEEKPKKFDMSSVYNAPLEKIRFEKIDLTVRAHDHSVAFHTELDELSIENRYESLRLDLRSQIMQVKTPRLSESVKFSAETQLLLDEDGLYFSNLHLQQGSSELRASGSILGQPVEGRIESIRAKGSSTIELLEIKQLVQPFSPNIKLPRFAGRLSLETDMDYHPKNGVRSNFLINGDGLKINQYDIGQLHATGKSEDKALRLSTALLRNTYGTIRIEGGEFALQDDQKFNAKLSSDDLALNPLFRSLGLPNVPVHADLKAELPCHGQFKSPFLVACSGALVGHKFYVAGGADRIVALENIEVRGDVTVNPKAVTYKTAVKIGSSSGESDGVIDYATGFKINYSTPKLNFSDVAHLAGSRPEGWASIKGETRGGAKAATIQLSAKGEDFWLYDFQLGRAQFAMSYRQGQLEFDKVIGQLDNTNYNAKVKIDLPKSRLEVLAQVPYLEADDLTEILARKITLPFTLSGTGSANLKVFGPLQFNRLSADIDGTLFRGTIADESYDQIRVLATSRDGHLKADKVSLTKGRSTMKVSGSVQPNGRLDLAVMGRQFRIEQSENLARLKVKLTGNLDFDTKLDGYISKPIVAFSSSITDAMVGDQAAADSRFQFKVTESEFSGEGQFLGQAIRTSFSRPHDPKGTSKVDVRFKDWNFAQVFSIFSDNLRLGGFQTRLSGSASVNVPNHQPQNFSGDFLVDEFILKNGRAEMSTRKSIRLTARDGIILAKDFEILGENTYVRLKSGSSAPRKINLQLEGRIDMTLAALFAPFLDEIRGIASFSFLFGGDFYKPTVSGSAFIEQGVVKLKGFPHAFEQLQADTTLTDNKLVINAIKGKLGGGLLTANGQVLAKGLTDLVVDIRGQVADARLNVPEGFSTRGSGDFFVRGNWFPYTVGVSYNVESGSIERKAAEASKATPDVKPSPYLPKFLSAQRFSPVVLALDVNIRRMLPVKMIISRVEIRCDVGGQMKISGPPEAPLLNGRVSIARGGKVSFRNNTFEIRSGTVEYHGGAPENPELNIEADANVIANLRSGDTREYDINLRVQGYAQNPKITVVSQPPLPENELISLLTLGFITETEADQFEATAGETLANTGYQMTSAFINEQLGLNRVLEENLGVRLDINSSYDPADKAEKHKFTLRKQWTPKFGTTASREIGKTNANNVKAEYKINKNLSLIGEWEGTEAAGTEQVTTTEDQNIFGLDIEYKVEFK